MSTLCQFETLAALRAALGSEAFVSDWVMIDQHRINLFAQATDDPQWIHVDTERASRESPFGGTIAHGFLTLSLLGRFYDQHLSLPFCAMGINYGLNRVRFTQPVRAGQRVRGRFHFSRLDEIEGGIQMMFVVTIEIDGVDKPACIAESLVRQYFRAAG
jgi:acyl dehydratase